MNNNIIPKKTSFQLLKEKGYTKDMLNNIKDLNFLMNSVIVEKQITMIYAPSNQGKTTAVMGILHNILTNKKDYEALYIDYDNGATTMKEHLLKLKDVENLTYIDNYKLEREDLFTFLNMSRLEDCNKKIFVFDSLQHFVTQDLSSNKSETEVKQLFELFKALRGAGATIIIISHTTKEKNDAGKETTFRGLNIIKDNLDNMFYLTRQDDIYNLKNEKTRHPKIEPFLKLRYNHNDIFTYNPTSLSDNEYQAEQKEKEDIFFINAIKELLKDRELNKSDLELEIKNHDDLNDLSRNKIKDIIKRYENKHWIVKKTGERNHIKKYSLV